MIEWKLKPFEKSYIAKLDYKAKKGSTTVNSGAKKVIVIRKSMDFYTLL